MIRTTTLTSLVLVCFAQMGCGGLPPGSSGEGSVATITYEYADLGGAHVFMSSPCPQPVGTILITNGGDVATTVAVRSSSTQLYFENGGPIRLEPGETIEVSVFFNCSSTADISTELVIGATPTDTGVEETDAIPFMLDIQGA